MEAIKAGYLRQQRPVWTKRRQIAEAVCMRVLTGAKGKIRCGAPNSESEGKTRLRKILPKRLLPTRLERITRQKVCPKRMLVARVAATPSNCGNTLRAPATTRASKGARGTRVMTSGTVKTLEIGQSAAKRYAPGHACSSQTRCCLLYTSPSPRDS